MPTIGAACARAVWSAGEGGTSPAESSGDPGDPGGAAAVEGSWSTHG
jgi:hypothetical protein